MDRSTFHAALDSGQQPSDLTPATTVLWLERQGDWEAAHDIAQDLPDPDGAWLHAYLHRREGDLPNANYWYRRAGRTTPRVSLDQEWESLAEHFCAAEAAE